ncbi:helix-turn-helix domain-containing protein [Vreelandella sp. EE22]
MSISTAPIFWRDPRMPYVELRYISDARQAGYARHSHAHWSLGAVTHGNSIFQYRDQQYAIGAGDLVLMNPHWVHACNPMVDKPWAYLMLYVDTQWVSELRYQAGLLPTPQWEDIATPTVCVKALYQRYRHMAACLLSAQTSLCEKQAALNACLLEVFHYLQYDPCQTLPKAPPALQALAGYLDQNALKALSLAHLCDYSGYSGGHLIRAFKQYYHMTPHAYVINRRIQLGQQKLKSGRSIADTALVLGFNDQPHFQRTFKRLVAATPNQYRHPSIEQDKDTTHR